MRCWRTYETVVSSVGRLWLEPHGSVVGTTRVVGLVVSTGCVPCETNEDGGEGAVCGE
jgi:hypothetical protein